VRSVESTALRVLRGLEEEGQKLRSASVNVRVPGDVAIYTLNQKRRELQRIESDYRMAINFTPKDDVLAGNFEIERIAQLAPEDRPILPALSAPPAEETFAESPADLSEEVEETEEHEDLTHAEPPGRQEQHQGQPGDAPRRKRRRRGGRGRGPQSGNGQYQNQNPQHQQRQTPAPSFGDQLPAQADETSAMPSEASFGVEQPSQNMPASVAPHDSVSAGQPVDGQRKRRRRRRGGRGRNESGNSNFTPRDNASESSSSHHENGGESHASAPADPAWTAPADERRHTPVEAPRKPDSIPHDTMKSEPSDVPASSEPRKGWWQRTFSS
jgi:ribonuclease E